MYVCMYVRLYRLLSSLFQFSRLLVNVIDNWTLAVGGRVGKFTETGH